MSTYHRPRSGKIQSTSEVATAMFTPSTPQRALIKWKFQTGDVVHASPAIVDGKLYIGSWDSYFYALDATNGKELWRFKTGEDNDTHNQVGIQSSATVVERQLSTSAAAIPSYMRSTLPRVSSAGCSSIMARG